MRRLALRSAWLVSCLFLGWPVFSARAEPGSQGAESHRRGIVVSSPGPQQLDVDLELLTGADSSLRDLRLRDGQNREVPYLLVHPPAEPPKWKAADQLQPIVADRTSSGFEADLGHLVHLDRVRFLGLPTPLMKRLRLEASGNRQAYVELLREATIFDLPDSGLRRIELLVPSGSYRYLRVIFDDSATSPVPLPSRAEARLVTAEVRPRPLVASVPFEERSGDPRSSRWRVHLPRKQLPITALELETAQPQLLRMARVSESRLATRGLEAVALGQSMLRRATNVGMVAADLRIPIARPETTELSLVVDNGSNPRFELGSVSIELEPQPFIYFDAPEAGTYQAFYGSPKLSAPEYDLEVERERILEHPRNAARWEGRAVRIAGEEEVVGESQPPESVTHAPVIDEARFTYARSIEGEGGHLVSVALDVAVLAHSRTLSDLRIVDARGRQVPYLFSHDTEPLVVERDFAIAAPGEHSLSVEPGSTVYRITTGYPRLPEGRLSLSTADRVFRRELSVYAPLPSKPRKPVEYHRLDGGLWEHADPTVLPPPFELAIPSEVGDVLFVVIKNGDNTPLSLTGARLLLPSRSLRFFHTQGETLSLLYGDPNLGLPRYDISLLAEELSQAPSVEAGLGPERQHVQPENHQPPLTRWFVVLLGATALILLVFIVRLVRKSEPTTQPSEAPDSTGRSAPTSHNAKPGE